MKILHVITSLGIKAGGPSTCTFELVKALNQNGCPTDILTDEGTPENPLVGEASFIHTIRANYKTPFAFSSSMRKALKQTSDYDLIHINGLWSEQSIYAAQIAKERKIPYIVSPHGTLYPQALAIKPWRKKIMRKLFFDHMLSRANCIHVTCEEEKTHYHSLGFTNPAAVIPNLLHLPEYLSTITADRSKKRIGFLGRFHPIKNIPALLEAWKLLGEKTKDCELLLIGSGEPEYEKELCRQAGAVPEKNVRFCGFLNGEDKYRTLASLTALCIPSHQENFGMTALEAMAVGTPVIASRTTPWHDLEKYHCGWWVGNSPGELADAILNVLELSDNDFFKFSKNSQALVSEKYSAAAIAAEMIKLYEKNIK